MGVEAAIVTIATGTGTSQLDVAHGMSATPQVAILMHAGTGTGGLDSRLAMGAFTSATERFGVTMFAEDGATTMDSANLLVTDGCLPVLSDVTTVGGKLDAVGFDATNVSVIPDTAFTVAKNISCLLLAGLTNVKVGTITLGAGTGAQSFTGVGFAPDVILFCGTSGVAAGTIAAHGRWACGWSTVTANRALALNSRDNVADSQTDGIISDDYAWVNLLATTGAVSDGFTVTSMDSDGFSINKSGTNTPIIGYIALKGCQAKIVDSVFRTDTNDQPITGAGFTPKAVLTMYRPGTTASEEGTATTGLTGGFGWGVSAAARFSVWVGEEDAQASSDVYATQDNTRIVHSFDQATGATTQGSLDLKTLDADGATLDQILAGVAASYLPVLFLGDAAASGPSNPSVDNASTGLRRSARRMVAIGD